MIRIIGVFIILIMLLNINLAQAESTSYCDYPGTIFYSPITSKVYLACGGDFSTLNLITLDPITLIEEHNFYIGGQADSVIPTDGGVNLLLLLSNVDGDTSSNDGALRKVNASTGALVPGYEIEFNDSPLTMVADSNQTYLYVVVGGLDIEPATINKIRISDFQIMPQVAHYGYTPFSIALTNNNAKLYIMDRLYHDSGQPYPNHSCFNIGVFNTQDMTKIRDISVGSIVYFSLKMGYDNRLFVSHPTPANEDNDAISLIVINTQTDTIIRNISLGETGIGDIDVDPIRHKLYGAVSLRDIWDPDLNMYVWRSCERIIEFDLTDPTYTPTYLTLDNEGLWDITVAPIPGSPRLFAIAEDPASSLVHYMNLW